ncbi:Protein translocase subunit SecA [Bienertia sinuspersici]
MDTSWIDLRNDDPAVYEGCKAFVELAKETSIEGNTRSCITLRMSYRSKRTRALSLSKDSHTLNNASQGPPKKTSSMSTSTTPLHNVISQPQKEVSKLSPTLQNLKLNSGRWGPFTPPPLNTTKTLQSTHEMSKNVEPTKPSSGNGQPMTNPKLDLKQKFAPQASTIGGIWKKSPSELVESQKSEEVGCQQSLRVEKEQEKAAELSKLPPMTPKTGQSCEAANSLRRNVSSSSPFPMQKNQDVASQQPLRVKGALDEVGELFDLPPMVPKKTQSSKTTNPLKHNLSSSHQPSPKQPSFVNQSNQPSSKQQPVGGNTKMQASSFRRHLLIPSWILDKPEFDDTVDVVTIDGEGNHSLVSGSIQAIDIWNNNGVSIAKQERFCPVGELDWHHIDEVLLADMINEIRDRFVIPDGEIYINKILSCIAKAWRQYKSHLKSVYFKPKERSQEEHYNAMPGGISRDNWRKLVKFWFSKKGQYMSECGKEARASQSHIHISGGKSYANIRADYEDKHGEEMSLVQLYEDVHLRKDGSFIEGTDTQDFLDDAKAKANMLAAVDVLSLKKKLRMRFLNP